MVTINDLIDENRDNLNRMNTPSVYNLPKRKVLIFEKDLAHKDPLIQIKDCPLATKDHRAYHALAVGGVITAGYPAVELYTMHMTSDWMDVIDWCISENIRVISMSIASFRTDEREKALKKYVEWGGFVSASSGNWDDHDVAYPASSEYAISVGGTNTEDSNGVVDITLDSYWRAKRYKYDSFFSFSGTSGTQPVNVPIMLRYQNVNTNAVQDNYRTWLLLNSINNIDHLNYDVHYGKLERGERYFIYPENMVDPLLPISIELTIESLLMRVNGEPQSLRVAPFLIKYSEEYGALCTELRPIFEAAGFTIDVDWPNKIITMYKE